MDNLFTAFFMACVLISIIETLRGFVDIYGGHNSFPEIFLPISTLLLALAEQENLPNALKEKIRGVEVLIKERTHEHHMLRRPLQMRKQKPVPIKLFNPKFEENFVKGRDYDPDRERAEQRKLKKLIKQEAKGAARELRKDNYFLFEVKKRDKAMQEEERAEKYGKAEGAEGPNPVEISIAYLPGVLKLKKELCGAQSLNESHVPDVVLERLVYDTSEFPPVCAILGGILGQEVIKTISGKGDPLKNFFFFDAIDGKGIIEDISNRNSGRRADSGWKDL